MIQALLAERAWLLADGAVGTNLFARGLRQGEAPELWNETRPREIRGLHQDFIGAGADIILTNSFGASASRLRAHDAADRARAINELAARHARAAVDLAEREILVAGSVGPTGAPAEDMAEIFAEQIAGLKDGGAEMIWIETMADIEEMRAAAAAASLHDLPYVVTASFHAAGIAPSGLSPAAMAEAALAFAPPPDAIGANCGSGPNEIIVAVRAMATAFPAAVLVAKAGTGWPDDPGSPEDMAHYACRAFDAGARIIGGCCGTTATHLAAMRQALLAHRPDEQLAGT